MFSDKKDMTTDLHIFLRKMPDFVLFPRCGFTLAIKLRNFDFESHLNTLIFLDHKMMSGQTVSDLG